MQNNMQTVVEKYNEKRQRKKKRGRVLLSLSLIAALCTSYLLILPAITKEGQAYCGYEEHTHSEECYVSNTITTESLICDIEESEEHTHGEGCFEITQAMGEPVMECDLEEHIHILECFSNPEADLETPETWKATFGDIFLSSNWSDDLVAIAQTQIGYRESEDNYIVLEDGETKLGITRYGQWYGMPYGEWSSMFAAFCVNYAGVEGVDYDADPAKWMDLAKGKEQYRDKLEYTPTAGDIVFLHLDSSQQADGDQQAAGGQKANAIGIITEYMTATADEPAAIRVIAGDMEDRVGESLYEVEGEEIVGYLELPTNPNPTSPKDDAGTDGESLGATTYADPDPKQGDKYHAKKYLYYKESSHILKMGSKTSSICTFLLSPTATYYNGWEPSVKNWSAANPGNYVVAYCCDSQTYSSSSGENYTTYTLDKSRFTDEDQRRTLDGIVKNAYPFLTKDEMKARLKADGINVDDCLEAELIAAAQWAIWDTTNVTGVFDSITVSSNLPRWEGTWNPLTKEQIGHQSNDNNKHIKTIRDWLVSQKSPVALAVSDYDANVTKTPEGLYDLEVTVNLNRPVTKDENVDVKLIASDKASSETRLATGANEFTLNIEGLTEAQILAAEVAIEMNGQGIQTYYYDSENYQDLLGGGWGTTYADLSFKLADETIDASVKKVWSPAITGDKPVQVQLYADGKAYGDKVTLNKANSWTYTWTDLPKLNALYNNVEYTIKEDLVPGYASAIEKQGGSSKVKIWQQITEEEFKDGGQYLIRSKSGYLGQHTFEKEQKLTWSNIDIADSSSTPKSVIWTASKKSGTNGGVILKNNRDNYNYYLGYESVYVKNGYSYDTYDTLNPRGTRSSDATTLYYKDGHLYYTSNRITRYFSYLLTTGDAMLTTDVKLATDFEILKLTEVDMPNSNINFVLTNTQFEKATSVEVTKEWQGKRDGIYPQNVEVTLLQNGQPYGNPVQLGEDNDWTYRWTDLPEKIGNVTYEYSIQETQIGGYDSKVEFVGAEGGVQKFKLTNTWVPEYVAMMLSKVDLEDSRIMLPGAVFELYGYALQGEPVTTISGTDEVLGTLEQTITVGPDGTVVIDDLIVGETYYLVETEAPEGYNLLEEPIKFTIEKIDGENVVVVESAGGWARVVSTDEGLAIEVKNEVGYFLPETGGIGEGMLMIVGAALIAAAAFIYLRRRSVSL